MQCPACKKQSLIISELEPDLKASSCKACSGIWITRHHYDAWRSRKNPKDNAEQSAIPAECMVAETPKAKICPQCGHLLLPYRVGHDLPFSIDYCGGCGGIWLDRSEWTAIKAKGLHDNLHEIVSAHWQNAIRQASTQQALEQTYQRQLGSAYAKAAEMRTWLRSQSQKGLILAYLADPGTEKK